MNQDWKIGFAQSVGAVILKEGKVVDLKPSYYNGWEDWDMSFHKNDEDCPVTFDVEVPTVHEESYVEWGGTFGTDTTEMCIDAGPVSCACGKITNRTVRMEGSYSSVIGTIFAQ